MGKRAIDPWRWSEPLGFTQGWLVTAPEQVLFVSGQGAFDADGTVVGPGDFAAQARQTLDNLGTVLRQAGLDFPDVVKLTVYYTDIGNLREFGRIRAEYMPGPPPASTALAIVALARPEMMLEVEAIAAR